MHNGQKILVVDSDGSTLLSIIDILGTFKLKILTAVNPDDALRLASEQIFSLIIIGTPARTDADNELSAGLRKIPTLQKTPFLYLTDPLWAHASQIRGISNGTADVLSLPLNPDILQAKVIYLLEREDFRRKALLAEQKSEQASQLLVNMSHEIRTPVNSILGFAELITSPSISEDDREKYTRYISNSSQNLLFLVDEILDFSRLDAGELQIIRSEVDINALCGELYESFQTIKTQNGKAGLPLSYEKNPAEPTVLVSTDPNRLRQVLANLLNNAIKYTESGSISFGYLLKENAIEFTVKDSGLGIAEEELLHIFDRFKRSGNLTESKISGSGIGLSISKNLVELMGGRIWAESKLGEGSVFRFTLPLGSDAWQQIPASEYDSIDLPGSMDWSSKTVLIAEDEELNFLFLQESLRSTGINVLWAKTGSDCIKLVTAYPQIDIVLMDIRMPEMDGIEAAKHIKFIRPALPVVIQTANPIQIFPDQSGGRWIDGTLTKPINRIHLLKTIYLHLKQQTEF